MLTPRKFDQYRQRLVALMRRINNDLAMLRTEVLNASGGEAGGGISNVPLHPADLSGHQFEHHVNLGLVSNEEQILAEADAALGRIDQGTFGICEKCRREIAAERLEAVPYSRFCATCAAKSS